MTEEKEQWGPWVEHDGKGCPPGLMGRFVLIQYRLSHDDREGGKAGQVHLVEALVTELYASLPDWERARFGEIAECPVSGDRYGVPDIERYRIRKPRGLTILEENIATLRPEKQPEGEVA